MTKWGGQCDESSRLFSHKKYAGLPGGRAACRSRAQAKLPEGKIRFRDASNTAELAHSLEALLHPSQVEVEVGTLTLRFLARQEGGTGWSPEHGRNLLRHGRGRERKQTHPPLRSYTRATLTRTGPGGNYVGQNTRGGGQ